MSCPLPKPEPIPLADVFETMPIVAEAIAETYCERCRSVRPVRRNRTQVRCDRGHFLGHREPRVPRKA